MTKSFLLKEAPHLSHLVPNNLKGNKTECFHHEAYIWKETEPDRVTAGAVYLTPEPQKCIPSIKLQC